MKEYYDIIYVTNLPAFYKIRLLNEISKHKSVLAIFCGFDGAIQRNADFSKGEMQFDNVTLKYSGFKAVKEIRGLLGGVSFKEMIVCGNNTLVYWYLALKTSRKKLSVVCESSIYESKMTGVKGVIKRFFNNRFSRCYASGEAAARLYADYGFKGEIVKTKGVGIFNYHKQPAYTPCSEKCNKLIYVGRLSPEKNLRRLIEVVNRNPQWQLSIVGFGPLESELKEIAGPNVHFLGAINNEDLPSIYRGHDAFVLPSTSEPWGLVVDEALNNGIPVAVTERAGCVDDWVKDGKFGITFDPYSEQSIESAFRMILTNETNNKLRKNISDLDFEQIAIDQINCYLS
ncbi:MAG: glycosyltransferase family 4 protein [Muribaculaceae bacterium]|nr:glycosyltransferase family 4 protein [Muribaculaceae bacterium]